MEALILYIFGGMKSRQSMELAIRQMAAIKTVPSGYTLTGIIKISNSDHFRITNEFKNNDNDVS